MKVYILHGYTASPDNHWFPWLEQELTQLGIACERLAMPNSNDPSPEKWQAYLEEQVEIDENTLVVGHSLGCITWLNFFAQTAQRPLAAVFVSGFYQPLDTIPELSPFTEVYQSLPSVSDLNATVIAAQDDHIVPHRYSDALAQHLNADYIRLNHGGHFLDREGWLAFPLVLETLRKIATKDMGNF